jgi:hypothetical protein
MREIEVQNAVAYIQQAKGVPLQLTIGVPIMALSFFAFGCGGGGTIAPGPPPPATQTTYTNPLSVTDSVTGPVTSCPDPSILKVTSNGFNTWYLYCTGDALNSNDRVNGNLKGQIRQFLRCGAYRRDTCDFDERE